MYGSAPSRAASSEPSYKLGAERKIKIRKIKIKKIRIKIRKIKIKKIRIKIRIKVR